MFGGKKVNATSCELALVVGYEEPKDNLNDRYKCIPLASEREHLDIRIEYASLDTLDAPCVMLSPQCQGGLWNKT